MDSERIVLKQNDIIELFEGVEERVKHRFKILDIVGQGSSSVCYRAQRLSDGKIGNLKEFYPADYATRNQSWYYSMYRQSDGQLYCSKEYSVRFQHTCEEYLEGYRLLNETIAKHPDSSILKNYVQNSEILYGGIQEDKTHLSFFSRMAGMFSEQKDDQVEYGTVYIWSVGLEGETFDKYLAKVRNHPDVNPGQRLNEILNVLITLTDAIKVFHSSGLLHLDIKPKNFLVALDSERNINSSNISIFDIDAIYSVDSEKPKCLGTEGYRAPELSLNYADHRADLYSIGAILFNAIIISDDIPDGLYKDDYYGQIDQLVKHSKLIVNSEAHYDIHLISRLGDILKKCLDHNYKKRYARASELLADLKDAKKHSEIYTLDPDILRHHRKTRSIQEEEKGIADPEIVIQKLLFEHPLFETAPAKDGTIHALVVGCGTYGQQFIDNCLQAGQMKDHKIQITAVSHMTNEDRESYIRFRPEITRFINVVGDKTESDGDNLGTVRFVSLRKAAKGFNGESPQFKTQNDEKSLKENRKLVHQIIQNIHTKNQKLQYVFVALGDEKLNYKIAQLFSEELSGSKLGLCPVTYVSNKKRKPRKKELQMKLYPVFINEKITPDTINPQLEQMAFNTHLVWNGFNQDIQKALNEFRNSRYDYESSMAFVLSLKYKLYSIGINTDHFEEAAKRFYEDVLAVQSRDKEAAKKLHTLTALEHRRWLLYMAADGWQLPRDPKGNLSLKECVRIGKAKNTAARTHACMLTAGEDTPLSSEAYTRNNRAKWDDPDIDPSLDDLDRMSVQMHQLYRAEVEELRRSDLFHENDLRMILTMISGDDQKISDACRQYRFCIRNILSGAEVYSKYYKEYKEKLLSEVNLSTKLSETSKAEIKNRIDLIDETVMPVIHANEYLDYKKIDEDLIEQIPFILTYKSLPSLAMAFELGQNTDGRNEEVFKNAASAMVLRPGRIRYYYLFNQKSDPKLLAKKVTSVLEYFDLQKIHGEVSMMIVMSGKLNSEDKYNLKHTLNDLVSISDNSASVKLHRLDYAEYENLEQASELIVNDLISNKIDLYDGSVKFFESGRRDGQHIDRIIGSSIPYFEFDSSSQSFTFCSECEHLKYLNTGASIRIEDMFRLMGATPLGFNLPEYAEDYEKLWDIYTGCYLDHRQFDNGIGNWNNLCNILADFEKDKDPLGVFPVLQTSSDKLKKKLYYLPSYALYIMRKIIQRMINEGVINQESRIYAYTSADCQAEIIATDEIHKRLKQFFSKSYMLLGSRDPSMRVKTDKNGKYLLIEKNDLRVENVNLETAFKGQAEKLLLLLNKLNEENFISDLSEDENSPGVVSFTYTSPRFRQLLTKAGEILEIYVYFEVLKQGYFDDAATGYQLEWAEGGVETELDLVLTKGFRSIIAECKAVRELDLDYYHKLDSLSNLFGIGNICILIGNTYRIHDQRLAEINEMQRSRGKQLNIITISEEKDIRNIGSVLADIMRAQIEKDKKGKENDNE